MGALSVAVLHVLWAKGIRGSGLLKYLVRRIVWLSRLLPDLPTPGGRFFLRGSFPLRLLYDLRMHVQSWGAHDDLVRHYCLTAEQRGCFGSEYLMWIWTTKKN